MNPSRAISENDLRIYSTTSSSNEEEEEEEGGGLDRERRYTKKAAAGPEIGRREESVEVNTEDEQSSRWETDNRSDDEAIVPTVRIVTTMNGYFIMQERKKDIFYCSLHF